MCVFIAQHRQLCRCRCATWTTQCEPKWGFSKVNKRYGAIGKFGAHCIIRYSFSLINSGKIVIWDAYGLKNAGVSQQPRCPSSHSFKQPAQHPPIYQVMHPQSQNIYFLSLPTAHTQTSNFPLQKSLQDLKGNLTHPRATCSAFIQKLHIHS